MSKPDAKQIRRFIKRCIEERREWASSPDGRKRLGPGSPTIPGLQEYHRILHYAETGEKDELAQR